MPTVQQGRGPQRWGWPLKLAAGLMLALGALELGLRSCGLGHPPLLVEDRQMEYRFLPNQTLQRFGHAIRINAWGMRSDPLEPLPPPGRQRLLVLGDSIVWGGADTDQDAIAVSRLQRRLGAGWEVANLATPSWGPANWLGAVHRWGLLGSRQVLLVISTHDAQDNPSYAPLQANPETPTSDPPLALLELWQRYILPRLSRSLPGVAPSPNALEPARGGAAPSLAGRPPADLLPPLPSLDALVSRVRAGGGRLVVLQFWERGELESDRPYPDHNRILALLRQRGVPVTQAGPILRRCAAAHQQPLASLYVDQIHPYTDLGQRCLAEALAAALQPLALPALAPQPPGKQPLGLHPQRP